MKAKIEIGLDTSKIKSGSKQAVQSFDKMATGMKSATAKIDGRADKTASNLKRVGNAGKQAGQEVRAGAKKGETGLNDLSNTAKKAERDIGGVAISVLGLGASITGLSDTIFGMKEKMVALERSQFGLEQTTEDVKRMQEDFDEAVKAGTMTAKEHERAVKDLELAYKDMAVEQKEIQAETEAMNSEWISFAVNTATTVVFSLTTITTALGAERTAKIGSALATNIATIANKKFVLSLWAIAKHPVFLIATAGLAIWESNLFGLRSEIEKWSGIDDLSLLGNLEKTFSSNIPEASAETYDAMESIEKKAEDLQETFDETTTQSNKGIIPMINDVGDCSVKSAKKVDSLTDSIENLKKKQQTFRLDYVNAEKKFQERVARISNTGATATARKSGLASFVNYLDTVGINVRESGMFGHSLTSKFTDPMKHWKGIKRKYPLGGQATSAIAKQQKYNASISGYDNNSTEGWSGKALDTLSNFQQRVSAQNAEFARRDEERKRIGAIVRAGKVEYWSKWRLGNEFGTAKSVMRSFGSLVNRHKKRVQLLRNLGYTVNNHKQKAEAEMQYLEDINTFTDKMKNETHFHDSAHTKSTRSLVVSLLEDNRKQDVLNMIEYRRRLGLISSGVI